MIGAAWSDRWFGLRNRLLASPRFQRWAAGFPLTRPVAQRRARAAFDLCAGFVYSQVLQACVSLKLFDLVQNGPASVEDLARGTGLPRDRAVCLLEAAAALRLLERRRGERYGLGVLGAALAGNPGAMAMIAHHALLYADLRDPLVLLRGERRDTALGRLWPYAVGEDPSALPGADVTAYSELMAASQPLVAEDVLAAYRLDRHRCLLDVGGGDGTFLIRAAAAAPHLALKLFDLPAVAARAAARFAESGLSGRAQVFGGNFQCDSLPSGADVVSLIRVIHDHPDETALALLTAVWRALPPGGTVLLAEPMAGTPEARGVEAYFLFYLLAMGSGRPRRPAELMRLLERAGFSGMRLLPTRRPMLVRVLVARRGV